MAVDANVLIFERIREESNLGKSLRAAIQSGFNRAFRTILDSNITTLIAALVLFQFGTGPVRGFATILSIGIISSMFTALVVTRLLLDLLTHGKTKINKLSMLRIIGQTKINFISFRKFAYIISIAVIVIGLFSFHKRGEGNYGIDFTGGTIQQFRFEKPVEAQDIRNALKDIGLGSASIQHFGNKREVIIRSFEMDPEHIIDEFKQVFKENKFDIMRVEKVGPSVGKDLRGKAIKALGIAILFMVVYISLRFEFRFAVAAIVALLHDLLITLGAISLTHREISAPVIAALLTIVGYSINDTIVVFDRIREDRKLMRRVTYKEIINASINQTLSRTILTSLTTLAVILSLYFLGGEVINTFAFVLMVGVIVGTYSSIFIASPILIDWPSKKVK
jgi:SecD/SecF fusion protein